MRAAALASLVLTLAGLLGCATGGGAIFPPVEPARVWPLPPDPPRVRYIGQLTGEESLKAPVGGWDAFQAVLTGPPPKVAFSRPTAVAVRGEVVFVADSGLGAVHRMDLENRTYVLMRGTEEDPFQVPIDVAVIDESVWVADRGRAVLERFTLAGEWQETLRVDALTAPVALAPADAPGEFWVADAAQHTCLRLNTTGEILATVGQRGGGPAGFNFPTGLSWDPAVGLVVADAMNFRVQVLTPDGALRAAFGRKGDAAGDFARPRDVAVDSTGHIYVLDNQFENVQVFTRDGQLLMAWGREGEAPGEFALPSGITIDPQDRIWIADSYNRRVQVFQYLTEPT
jgi:streptogramin lyase